jgi:hypothetical protein
MMKRIASYQFALIVSIIVLTSSCEYVGDLDFDYKYPGDRLVVHALFSLDTFVVSISKTISPLSPNNNSFVTNPNVSLYENDQFLFYLHERGNGLYSPPVGFATNSNFRYRIAVEAEGLDEVASNEQVIPQFIPIDSIKVNVPSHSANPNILVNVWFNDPISTTNYYCITGKEYRNGGMISSSRLLNNRPLSDNTFNGMPHSLSLGVDRNSDSLIVSLHTVTPDLYRFLKSIDDFDYTNQDPFIPRPTFVYSNINGGYGIFGAFNSCSWTVRLK